MTPRAGDTEDDPEAGDWDREPAKELALEARLALLSSKHSPTKASRSVATELALLPPERGGVWRPAGEDFRLLARERTLATEPHTDISLGVGPMPRGGFG